VTVRIIGLSSDPVH